MVFLEWIVLLNPHVFASRPWDLSAWVEHGTWLLESSLMLVTAEMWEQAGACISWLQHLGERGFGCLEVHFLSQKKNVGHPFPGREAQEFDWRLPNAGRGTKRSTWPTVKDAAAS